MNNILASLIVPHPPLIIKEIGKGEELKISRTIKAYKECAEFVKSLNPETIILSTPHSRMYSDYFHLSPGTFARGSFKNFGAPSVTLDVEYDNELVKKIEDKATTLNFPCGTRGEKDKELDHGTMIPLYFLKEAYKAFPLPKIIRLGLSGLSLSEHYELGMIIRETAQELNRKIVFIASGDCSHRLKEDGPYGFSAAGPLYDEKLEVCLKNSDFLSLITFDDKLLEEAAECGHRSFSIMAGLFEGHEVTSRVLSHEGPFGVGYLVATFIPGKLKNERLILDKAKQVKRAVLENKRTKEDEYVRLARLAVESYIKDGIISSVPKNTSSELLDLKAGTFVSLHLNGNLRGCIGTISPTTKTVAEEIIQNSISACSQDPRFNRVEVKELPFLEYSVDVLAEPLKIKDKIELDVKRFGVIVKNGNRRGLLLPDLDGVNSIEEQISIAKQKANIRENEEVELERFEVIRHV